MQAKLSLILGTSPHPEALRDQPCARLACARQMPSLLHCSGPNLASFSFPKPHQYGHKGYIHAVPWEYCHRALSRQEGPGSEAAALDWYLQCDAPLVLRGQSLHRVYAQAWLNKPVIPRGEADGEIAGIGTSEPGLGNLRLLT